MEFGINKTIEIIFFDITLDQRNMLSKLGLEVISETMLKTRCKFRDRSMSYSGDDEKLIWDLDFEFYHGFDGNPPRWKIDWEKSS